jgi:LacI family transcriptional regulator
MDKYRDLPQRLCLDFIEMRRMGCETPSDNIALLQHHRVPIIILERSLGSVVPDRDFVGHDNFQSGHLATQRLLEAGHRRVAFLGWDSPIPNLRDRARGYHAALAEAGVAASSDWLLLDDLTQEGGRRLAERLARLDVTAAVIAHHHDMASAVFRR